MTDIFADCFSQTLSLIRETELFSGELAIVNYSLSALKKHIDLFLHPTELTHFERLTFERRQQSYLLGRLASKLAFVRYKKVIEHQTIPLNSILIDYGVFNFPVLCLPEKNTVQISYSHSGTCAVGLAFPEKHPMGVDLEFIHSDKNHVIATQLTPEEKTIIANETGISEAILFTLFWTVKEALSKILRTGLMSPFAIFSLKNLREENGIWISEFSNFSQYQAYSFLIDQFMCSLVFPKKTQLKLNLQELKTWCLQMRKTS